MDNNNIILIAIVILVIALIAVGAYIATSLSPQEKIASNATNSTVANNTTSEPIMIDENGNVTNDTVVGDNSKRNDTNTSNSTYRVYNPQSDSYVTVIGEGYDDEVDRWYTYDTDGVRYYNTRIHH